ncbi:TPA: DNA-directed RNA polymerase [Candidatus Woesearchaeota archaeon]|nr:DNA-directed RNA polymerase [Candidatus Woesearchaeota archaeon]
MFYKITVHDHIRVPPNMFGDKVEDAVLQAIRRKYEGFISQELGIVIDVLDIGSVGDGKIIPGDGAAYYQADFSVITFKPEMQEVVMGKIRDIADFGAFISLGPIEGMIHISQTMDDFVSFSKDKVLTGKESKRTLKPGDICRARIIAISFKDPTNPKLGLTMRQQGLGRLDWVEDEQKEEVTEPKKAKK